jgi:site-specific recombinase XerD
MPKTLEEIKTIESITQPQTDTNWLHDFEAWLSVKRSAKTVADYRRHIRLSSQWFELENHQAFTPDLLTSIDLRSYAKVCLEQLKPASWNCKRAALAVFCSWCLEAGHVSYQPFQNIPIAREIPLPPRWLEEPDFKRLMRSLEQDTNRSGRPYAHQVFVRDQAMVSIMVFAGLRVQELVDLTMADVQLGDRKGRLVVRHGKGDKRREVPLSHDARRALTEWLEIRDERAGPVFCGKNSEMLSTRQVERRVREIGRLVQLELSPHDLRHTFAKRLLRHGVDLVTISRLMGHEGLEATRRYIEPGWADLEAAVNL